MGFQTPSWVPPLPEIPDSIPLPEFIFNEEHGRYPLARARPPFTCGLSGKSYSALEVRERIDFLARSMAKELRWEVNAGTEWDKVVGVFSLNTIDTLTVAWAAHRLNGISSPANAVYSVEELVHQLRSSKAKCIFTCLPLLDTALKAAKQSGIPRRRVYILEMPQEVTKNQAGPSDLKTVSTLILEGANLPQLGPQRWSKGQGARQCAFLCYSSGTSGLPKGVMISHKNVIANVLQVTVFEQYYRDIQHPKCYTETVLGLLPNSHIYGLVVACHCNIYRGDGVLNLPKFDMRTFLESIQKYKISILYLVPPIVVTLVNNVTLLEKYDLTSVKSIFCGAAPLSSEISKRLQTQFPTWKIRQGYGLTETATVVSETSPHDVWYGSAGSILPGCEVRLVTLEGVEVTGYDQPGELVVKSPSVVLGYLNNDKANKETFIEDATGRWLRTGDEAVIRESPSGFQHIWIVDRIKELIKSKGHQVAPAELEAHLLDHPSVADAAVIPVPDEAAGEVPKAFVVKSATVGLEESDRILAHTLQKYVEKSKAKHKWLRGGVEFVDVIPKSPSGKILRRLLRDREKERRRKLGAKI